jgi:FlgN protein
MTDNKGKYLGELTEREAKEFDKMAVILNTKHQAISKLNTRMVQQVLVEELEELKRIQTVEKERVALLENLSLNGDDLNNKTVLETKLGEEGARNFMPLHSSFQKSFARVISLNSISRALLKHSLAFIRQNINILTEGGKRKLVDRKA